jgi:hypothetical protein
MAAAVLLLSRHDIDGDRWAPRVTRHSAERDLVEGVFLWALIAGLACAFRRGRAVDFDPECDLDA